MPGTTLVQHIRQQEKKFPGATGEFTSLMNELVVATKIISLEVNRAGIGHNILGLTGEVNIQGEEVQKLDRFANNTIIELLRQSETLCAMGSEENDEPIIFPQELGRGKYIMMIDPLDGSSNIDVNVSIGTIFSIYRKKSTGNQVTRQDLFQKADEQVAAGYIIYGSSTMFVYTYGEGVHGFTLDPEIGEFFLSHPNIRIPQKGSIYSVNEGCYEYWDEKQKSLVQYFKTADKETDRPYRLRYVGTLVSDFHRTLLKGGIFMYPRDQKNPNGKLRFMFEAAPLALIMENSGGVATDGEKRILDIMPHDLHQRTPLFIGSQDDMEKVGNHLSHS